VEKIVITHAKRSAIGKFCGALQGVSAVDFTTQLAKKILQTNHLQADIDHVILGMARQAGAGPNPARQVQIFSGIPEEKTAWTLNMACGSGLLAILQAADLIRLGKARIVLAGGMESMTEVPFLLPGQRMGYRLGHPELIENMYQDGFHCLIADQLMGRTAETLAEDYGISREEQDAFACRSQEKCARASRENLWQEEILPLSLRRKKDVFSFKEDEHPRPTATLEKMAKLPAVFKEEGSVTAGNSSGITDGAALLILMSESEAQKRDLPVLAVCGVSCQAGVDPKRMGLGPVPATRRLLKTCDMKPDDFDLIELNEAFAAQVIACDRELELPAERLNVNGGSIALGHPIGCTGARFVVTLLHEMKRRQAKQALATLCISGGQGIAVNFTGSYK
jgi:acetyl-CoA C-acetyltransferase